MKQLFLIVVLAFSFTLYGQNNWPKEGAQWKLCKTWIDWPGGQVFNNESSVIYAKDTVINGTSYQVSEEITETGSVNLQVFTRFQNDTIFRLIDQNEYLFFTYNATVGDTLSMRRTGINDYNEDTCSFSLELKCTEIFEITIEGNNYLCWEFQDVGNSVFGTNNQGESTGFQSSKLYWLETVGWIEWFPWAIQRDEHDCNSSYSYSVYKFPYYYSDNEIELEVPNQTHDSFCDTTLNIHENLNKNSIVVYPNPVSSELIIEGIHNNDCHFVVQSFLGQQNLIGSVKNQKIDVSSLSNGMYHLLIYDNNTLIHRMKFLKE